MEYNQILPERGVERIGDQCSGHICQVATDRYSSKNFSQLVSWDQLRGEWSKVGRFYAQKRFTTFYKYVTCEMRDLSRVSENLLTPPKSPEMNTNGTEPLEKLFTIPYTMSLSHATLPSPFLSPSPSCYHLKAKATSPITVETNPRRQRG